ncbi:MAG: ABC transporter transmembrane domain-containing protein, partial [Alphaproteobacteria bacterium]
MLKNFLMFLRLCWLAADTVSLKLKLLSDIIVSLIGGLTAFASPLFLSWIIKNLTEQRPNQALFWFYGLVVSALLLWITRYYWRYAVEPISTRLELNLRQIYFTKLFHKPYAWHLNNSVGYFSSALERVCTNMHGWLCDFPIDFLPTVVLLICFFGYTFSISPWLFLYFIAALTLMFFLTYLLYNKRVMYLRALTAQNLKFNKLYIDFLYNIRSVKKMNLKPFADQKIADQADKTVKKAYELMHYNAFQWGFMEFVIQGMSLIPIGFFLHQYIQIGTGLDVVVMIAAIAPQMEQSGRRMMYFMTASARVMAEYERLSKHLGQDKPQSCQTQIQNWETITFDKTRFEFIKDGHIFHHSVDFFQIRRGDHIAVTGKSGEGKSTFLNLLTGQFPCINGQIRVNNVSYQDIGSAYFDKHIAYISQDVELFDMSLYDN